MLEISNGRSHASFRRNAVRRNAFVALAAGVTVSMVSAPLFAADGTWNNPNGGNWNLAETQNWVNGVVASGADATARFDAVDLDLAFFNTTIAVTEPVTIGNLIFADTDPATPGNYTFNGAGPLTLAGAAPSITVNAMAPNARVRFDLGIAGTQGLTINGTNTAEASSTAGVHFAAGNPYTGNTTLNNATVYLGSGTIFSSFGNTGFAGTSGNGGNGLTLTLNGFNTISNGMAAGNTGALQNNLVVNGTTTINMGNRFGVGIGTGTTDPGASRRRTVTGAGTLILNASTTVSRADVLADFTAFTGTTQFTGSGTYRVMINGGFVGAGFTNSNVAIDGTAKLSFQTNSGGNTVNFGSLSGTSATAGITGPSAGTSRLSVGGLNTSTTFAGVIEGNNSLTKVGTGTLTLTGASTYTGATLISAGTLAVSGSGNINGSPTITIADGANFDVTGATGYGIAANQTLTNSGTGTGTVTGTYQHQAGTITPGGFNVARPFNFTNNFNVSGGSIAFDISPTLAAGGTNDLFVVGGTSALSGNAELSINSIGGYTEGTYTVIQTGGGITGDFSNWALKFASRTARASLDLSPDGKSLLLNIASTGAAAANLDWKGTVNAAWDVNTTANFFNNSTGADDKFFQGDNVRFGDTYGTGTTAGTPTNTAITLAGVVIPGNLLFDANSTAYSITGAGSIGGTGTLTKTGTANLTLATAPNTFSGGASITGASTVTINGGNLGTGPVTLAGGPTIVLNGGHVVGNALTVTDAATIRSGAATSGVAALSGAGTLTAELAGANFDLTGSHADFTGSLVFRKTTTAAITSIRLNGTAGGANTTYDIGDGVEMYKRNGAGTITLGALQGTAAASLRSSGNGSTTFIIGTKTGVDSNFAGVISDTGATPQAGFTTSLTKAGDTTLTLTGANTYTGPTVVQAGTLLLGAAAHAPVLTNAGGADLQGGKLVLSYAGGTNPASQVQSILDAGFDLTPKFSTGQIRSTTLPEGRLIGWIDRPANEAVTIAVTLPGDTDVNLAVNFDDLLALAQNYDANGTGKVWSQGDSNYDGTVNFDDLLALAQNYGSSALAGDQVALVGESFAADFAMAQSLVPEPATLGLLAGGLTLIGRRRRA